MLSGRSLTRRTARLFDAFDRRLDEVVTPVLRTQGFHEAEPYLFVRSDSNGRDICYFDISGQAFVVRFGYQPTGMLEINDLYKDLVPAGYLGTGYLTPKSVTHRPKIYSYRLASHRDRSFEMIVEGLTTHGRTWLASLRDPVVYADAVFQESMMCVGRANELAGRFENARQAYEEQMRRELAGWDLLGFPAFAKHEGAKVFVYLCLKLGRELDKCERVMEAVGYRPRVDPLEHH